MEGLDENTCLHCGEGKSGYCEDCYQELIGKNAKLQEKGKKILDMIVDEIKELKIKHMEAAGLETFSNRITYDTIRTCTLDKLYWDIKDILEKENADAKL